MSLMQAKGKIRDGRLGTKKGKVTNSDCTKSVWSEVTPACLQDVEIQCGLEDTKRF